MKPETLAIFGFLVSLIAYGFVGILLLFAGAASSSFSSSAVVSTGFVTVIIFTIIGALLTGLKVYQLERT
jgi:hypothetical protein